MRWAPLLLLLTVSACASRRGAVDAQLDALVREADRAWDRRGGVGLGPTDEVLQRAAALREGDPRVQWRLTRLRVAEARIEEDPERRLAALARARSLGWDCALADSTTRATRAEHGLARALGEVPTLRQSCVVWGALAWALWLTEFGGEAGSLDLEALDAATAAPVTVPEHQARLRWASALVAASRPTWDGRDLAQARALFDQAIAVLPGEAEARADRFSLVDRGSEREAAERAALAQVRASTPEAKAALARALGTPPDRAAPPEPQPEADPQPEPTPEPR